MPSALAKSSPQPFLCQSGLPGWRLLGGGPGMVGTVIEPSGFTLSSSLAGMVGTSIEFSSAGGMVGTTEPSSEGSCRS